MASSADIEDERRRQQQRATCDIQLNRISSSALLASNADAMLVCNPYYAFTDASGDSLTNIGDVDRHCLAFHRQVCRGGRYSFARCFPCRWINFGQLFDTAKR